MVKLFFLLLSLYFVSCNDIRTIQLDLFDHEDSYLPVRPGSVFILEAKGNKSTGYNWTLANARKIQEKGILKCINLDENHSGDYYQHHDEELRLGSDGLFHFKFEASSEKYGMEKLEFHYKKESKDNMTLDDPVVKKVNINVVRPTTDL